jgi:hypothetical protein
MLDGARRRRGPARDRQRSGRAREADAAGDEAPPLGARSGSGAFALAIGWAHARRLLRMPSHWTPRSGKLLSDKAARHRRVRGLPPASRSTPSAPMPSCLVRRELELLSSTWRMPPSIPIVITAIRPTSAAEERRMSTVETTSRLHRMVWECAGSTGQAMLLGTALAIILALMEVTPGLG